ncbi:MAG: OsmC family protein [Acidimicrobiia bacterium]|nr:OsmC family protein [Acidimicrobiia bacterium]MDX2468347.1 OsmC family protein [Acidimicrobiia bacterium]
METIATVTHVSDRKFDAVSASGHTVRLEGGAKETGPGPMEMVLAALGGCSTLTIVEFLEKMRQPVTSLEVELSAERATEPPKVYTKVHAHYRVGGDVDKGRVERAISLTEEKYCSVHTMLAQAAEMTRTVEFV